MNNGMKIILARMDTNPEEFLDHPNNWVSKVDRYWDIFTDEERDAYQAKLREILGDKFSELILRELMEDPEETMRYKATERYATAWTDSRAIGGAVSLTGTQVAVANAIGISLEDYAEQLAKLGK